VLGERWTLLILRELIGGARRYGDLRAALPGIATNLLADRRRELEEAGLVARTVYSLNTAGWHKVPPVVKAVATFGLDLIEPTESALTRSMDSSPECLWRSIRRPTPAAPTTSTSTAAVSNSRFRQPSRWRRRIHPRSRQCAVPSG